MKSVKQLFLETNVYNEYAVLEFPFNEEDGLTSKDILEEIKPFLNELGVKYITSTATTPAQLSMNVPYEHVDEVKELMQRYGFGQDAITTTGDEDRNAKNDGRLDGGIGQGQHGVSGWTGYMGTRLIGELPGEH